MLETPSLPPSTLPATCAFAAVINQRERERREKSAINFHDLHREFFRIDETLHTDSKTWMKKAGRFPRGMHLVLFEAARERKCANSFNLFQALIVNIRAAETTDYAARAVAALNASNVSEGKSVL